VPNEAQEGRTANRTAYKEKRYLMLNVLHKLLNSTEQYTGKKDPVRPKRLQSDQKSGQYD